MPWDLLDEMTKDNKAVMILDGVYEAVANRYFTKNRNQPFYPMKETVIPFFSGFTMAKDHYAMKIIIDKAIEKLVEAGIVMQFMSKWVPPDCKHTEFGKTIVNVTQISFCSSESKGQNRPRKPSHGLMAF